MATTLSDKTKFWIICKEETALTQKLADIIRGWKLSGVAVHVGNQLSVETEDAIFSADYAIFISLCEQPCSHLQITPLQITPLSAARTMADKSPASWLNRFKAQYGNAPHSWWFQLPTTELNLRGVRHIPPVQVLSQATKQLEVFVRNYYLQSLSMESASVP